MTLARLAWLAPFGAALLVATSAVGAGSPESSAADAKAAGAGPVADVYIPSARIDVGAVVPEATALGDSLAVDADGNLYVIYALPGGYWDVAVVAPDGRFRHRFGLKVGGRFSPHLAVGGPNQYVYLTHGDGGANPVEVYTRAGQLVGEYGAGQFNNPRDVEVDAAGNIYVVSPSFSGHPDDEVVRLNAAGQVTGRFAPLPASRHGYPAGGVLQGVAVALDGTMWVTSAIAKRSLLHLAADGRELSGGVQLDVLLPDGGRWTDVDVTDGRLYVLGTLNHRDSGVAVIRTTGEVVDSITGSGRSVAVGADGAHVIAPRPRTLAAMGVVNDIVDSFRRTVPYTGGTTTAVVKAGCTDDVDEMKGYTKLVSIVRQGSSRCNITLVNTAAKPCAPGTGAPTTLFVGSEEVNARVGYDKKTGTARVTLPYDSPTGQITMQWLCTIGGKAETRYELKGNITLRDPSGTIVDARTRKPVEAASVALEFSPLRAGRFGAPPPGGYSPQINPQTTSRKGLFGWDVAEGYWRLRVTAFGYRPFVTQVFHVPPEVTGLVLRLRHDPAEQRLLVDPRGRAGSVRVGARLGSRPRVSGLRVTIARGRVSGIKVLSRRFRTASGIRLGSSEDDLIRAYAAATNAQLAKRRAKTLPRYRVDRATFAVRRGRVVGISLGR